MRQLRRRSSTWAMAGALLAGAMVACAPAPRETAAPPATPQRVSDHVADAVRTGLDRLPVSFVANQGRWDARASWVVPGAEATAYFVDGGVRWTLAGDGGSWALDQVLIGARPAPPTASIAAAGTVSYLGAETHAGLPTAQELSLAQAWPGVDVAWSGTAGRIEATYRVAAGADPGQVRVAWRGAESVAVTHEGRLTVTTPLRTFEEDAPKAFQDIDGRRVPVEVAYELDGTDVYGFRLGPYDPAQPLVIDPTVLVYAGFLGGSGNDTGRGIAVDSAGNAYVTGDAGSREATFPETPGAFQPLYGDGSSDAFVAKVNPSGSALVYASFLGGTGNDIGLDIAVDGAGNAYVTGQTTSSAASFPETSGVFQPESAGGTSEAFVAKVNPTGSALVYAGFLGGSAFDVGNAIAVDGAGNAYVTGLTNSLAATFPVTAGAFGTENAGGFSDAFVAKVNPTGSALVYAGFLGGSARDAGEGIAVDSAGNAYISGTTASSAATFPETPGVFQPEIKDTQDAFVAKVNATGSALSYASFLGGNSSDSAYAIAVDGSGNAYVTGATASLAATFPVTAGVFQAQNAGNDDAFVAKVNPSGSALVYASFLGGTNTATLTGNEIGLGIALDAAGNAYVAGRTSSPAATFPETPGAFQAENAGGNSDAFVAKVNATGSTLLYASFLGGSAQDSGNAIAVDGAGNAYITGEVQSLAATFPETPGTLGAQNAGLRDAFVAKIAIPATINAASHVADFDGDGKTDFGIYRAASGGWYVALAGGGSTSASWGAAGDVWVPGDYNGDRKTDFGIYRPANGGWYVALAGGGSMSATWGVSGDVPVPGDYNGDGKTDFGVYRPTTGAWYVSLAGGGSTSATWGVSGDVPVPGDYNGDGKTDFGVYRPTTGGWYVAFAGGGTTTARWGTTGDVPVPGDYNGDGRTDFGVYRPSSRGWHVAFAGGGSTSATWGTSGDVPVPGDYNGDGKTDFGVYRPTTGGWYVALAGGGTTSATWGGNLDVPLPLPYAIWKPFYGTA